MPAKLEVLDGANKGESHDLPESGECIIGNRRSADIPVRDPWISWNHAKVYLKDGRFWVEDLDSSNGVWANRQRQKLICLEEGMEFLLGRTRVRFFSGSPGAAAAVRPPVLPEARPPQPPPIAVAVPRHGAVGVPPFEVPNVDPQGVALTQELRELRSRSDALKSQLDARDQELWQARQLVDQQNRRLRQLEEDVAAAKRGQPPFTEHDLPLTVRQTLAQRDAAAEDLRRRLATAEHMASTGSRDVLELQRKMEEQRALYEEKLQLGVRLVYQLEKDLMERESQQGPNVEALVAQRVQEAEAHILADFQRRWAEAEAGWHRELETARALLAEAQAQPANTADADRLRVEVAGLSKEKADLLDQLASSERHLAESRQMAAEAERVRADLELRLARTPQGAPPEVLAAAEDRAKAAEARAFDLQQRLDAAEKRATEADLGKGDQEKLRREADSLRSELSTQGRQLEDLRRELAEKGRDVERLRDAERRAKDADKAEAELATLRQSLANAEAELRKAQSQAASPAELEDARAELSEAQQKVGRLERENNKLHGEVQSLEEELEKAKKSGGGGGVDPEEFNEMAAELEDALKKLKKFKAEKAEMEKELARLEDELESRGKGPSPETAAENESLKAKNRDLERELHALEEELEKKEKKLQAANKEIDSLEAELAELEKD